MLIKMVTVLMSGFIMLLLTDLIRKEKLTFKYAWGWFCIAFLSIICVFFDQSLFFISYSLGFELPSNFIFFVLLSVLVFVSLFVTIFLCQQNRHNDIIAQKLAILEYEVRHLRKKNQEDRLMKGKGSKEYDKDIDATS